MLNRTQSTDLRSIELIIKINKAQSRQLWVYGKKLVHHAIISPPLHLGIVCRCLVGLPRSLLLVSLKFVDHLFTAKVASWFPRVEHTRPTFPLYQEIVDVLAHNSSSTYICVCSCTFVHTFYSSSSKHSETTNV